MSNRTKSCTTCQFAHWAERMPSCPDCRNFSKWVKSEPRPSPEPIYIEKSRYPKNITKYLEDYYIGHRTEGFFETNSEGEEE